MLLWIIWQQIASTLNYTHPIWWLIKFWEQCLIGVFFSDFTIVRPEQSFKKVVGKLVANSSNRKTATGFLNKAIWIVFPFWNGFLSTKVYKRFFAPSTFLFLATGMKSLKWKKEGDRSTEIKDPPSSNATQQGQHQRPLFKFFPKPCI